MGKSRLNKYTKKTPGVDSQLKINTIRNMTTSDGPKSTANGANGVSTSKDNSDSSKTSSPAGGCYLNKLAFFISLPLVLPYF